MIEVKNLSKHYKGKNGIKKAVDDISFSVGDNEIVGLLGPNGAGKTTTMNMICGYISSTDGEILIDGENVLNLGGEAKKNIGYLPELPPLYLDMTVEEYLNFVYELKGVGKNPKEHIAEICDKVKISDVSKRLIKNLSKGYKQRVGLAAALIGDPKILILDEPTVGLDPGQIIEIRNVIKKLGRGHSVILSSHILSEISAVCDRIIIINEGKIVASDKTENLSQTKSKAHRYIARIKGEKDTIVDALRSIDGITRINPRLADEAGIYDLGIEAERDIREDVFYKMAEINAPLIGMRPRETSLEETFIKITTGAKKEVL